MIILRFTKVKATFPHSCSQPREVRWLTWVCMLSYLWHSPQRIWGNKSLPTFKNYISDGLDREYTPKVSYAQRQEFWKVIGSLTWLSEVFWTKGVAHWFVTSKGEPPFLAPRFSSPLSNGLSRSRFPLPRPSH